MPDYSGSFSAYYDPNLRTTSTSSFGSAGQMAGLSIEDLINQALRLKRAGQRDTQVAALGSAPRAAQAPVDPVRRFFEVKQDLDALQSRDPWAGRAYGQAQGMNYFNFPAASALTYGKDIFPNGFETYAQLLGAGGGVNPMAQAKFGTPTPETLAVEYDPKTGQAARSTRTPGIGGWGQGF